MNEIEEELQASYSKGGPIRPAIKTPYGIAAGETRLRAVAEWPIRELDGKAIPNRYEHLKLKAADNIAMIKPAEWWEQVVNEAAAELVNMGTPREQIADKMAGDGNEAFPMSGKKLLRYLHEEYKHPEKVRAGRASAEVRNGPVHTAGTDLADQGFRLTTETELLPNRDDYKRKTYTPEELQLQAAFSGRGFVMDFQHPVPMDKWKCIKCRETWIEEPPKQCPKDGNQVARLNYYVDILVRHDKFKWSIEPGGKQHDFESDKDRDDFLRANGIEPLHFDNDLVRCGAWLIVAYVVALVKLKTFEDHTIVFEGYARHIAHNSETVIKETEFWTEGPAHVKVITR